MKEEYMKPNLANMFGTKNIEDTALTINMEHCLELSGLYSKKMHSLATELFPICRSITGNGVRKTLEKLKEELPELDVFEVESGTQVFDWTIPNEWNLNEAYIIDPNGNKICSTDVNNLHLLNYSVPIDIEIELDELKSHLYTLPEQPDAIPYVTSYYKERWGFCLTHNQFKDLVLGKYRVYINTTLQPGHLTYAELKIPGDDEKEVFFSTYICHPSMANNELSGPVLTTFLAKWIQSLPKRRYSYRFVFIPETIGSITYLSQNLDDVQKKHLTGFNVSCVGDERAFSYLPSRDGNGLADVTIKHVLKNTDPNYITYSYLERGSDERQYCAPGVDLKIASLMRSKYGTYPEYHTSKDDLNFVTAKGLGDCLLAYMRCISIIENNYNFIATQKCEPQMGKRGLYPTIGNSISLNVRQMMNILAYCDGNHSLIDIANVIGVPAWEIISTLTLLETENLIKKIDNV
ncbi:MAG: aminopeptidase-like protein [Psychroserpens sp.]|jgi:aminopeptidase-like protein